MQCDYNNFWRHGKTERNQCTDALGDIKVAVSFLVQSTVFGVCVFGGTDSKEGVLTAMCMSAHREWDGVGQDVFSPYCGIVLHHDDEGVLLDTFHRLLLIV